jgi:hypothetical protein
MNSVIANTNDLNELPSAWSLVSRGLFLKKIAVALLFIAMVLIFGYFLSPWVFMIACVPLSVDLVGRTFCLAAPVPRRWPIRLSVASQVTGLIVLVTCSLAVPNIGVGLGLLLAMIFQISAARLFTVFLTDVARRLERDDLASRIDKLRTDLRQFLFSFYGFGMIVLVTSTVAVLAGIMMFGFGLIFTIPIGMMIILVVAVPTFGVYVKMVRTYHDVISQVNTAVRDVANANYTPLASDADV